MEFVNETEEKLRKSFEAMGFKYHSPKISTKQINETPSEKAHFSQYPVYMDQEGNAYNLYYIPLSNMNSKDKKTNTEFKRISKQNSSERFSFSGKRDLIIQKEILMNKKTATNLQNFPKFPSPEKFKTYKQFENAVLEWKEKVNELSGFTQLPKLMGKFLSRPICREELFNFFEKSISSEEFENKEFENEEFENEDFLEFNLKDEDFINSFDFEALKENESIENDQEKQKSEQTITKETEETNNNNNNSNNNNNNNSVVTVEKLNKNRSVQFIIEKEDNNRQSESHLKTDEYDSRTEDIDLKTEVELTPLQELFVLDFLESGKLSELSYFKEENFGIDLEDQICSEDIWNSNLYPCEPSPFFYPTFEEFDRAYCRWAQLCVLKINKIPIHAIHLQKLIGLTVTRPQVQIQKKTKIDPFDAHFAWKAKIDQNILNNSIILNLRKTYFKHHQITSRPSLYILNIWSDISPNVKSFLDKSISTLFTKSKFNQSLYKSNSKPVLGILHGVMKGYGKSVSGVNDNSRRILISDTPNDENALIRNDSSTFIEGIPLEFCVSQYDFSNSLSLKKIKREAYIQQKQKEMLIIESKSRFDIFFTWFDLKKFPPSVHTQQQNQILDMMYDCLTFRKLYQIITSNQFLDKFAEIWNPAMLQLLTPRNLKRIMILFEHSSSALIHVKIAFLITRIFIESEQISILQKYVETFDLQALYWIAFGINLFNEIPTKIFPIIPTVQGIIRAKFPKTNTLQFTQLVQCYYYLSLIRKAVAESKFEVKPTIKEEKRDLKQNIDKYSKLTNFIDQAYNTIDQYFQKILENEPEILNDYIFEGISSRSSSLSSYCLFIIIQLFNTDSKIISETLFSAKFNFVEKLTKISNSKFQHVQIACKYIWRKMKKKEFLQKIAIQIGSDKNMIKNSLFPELNVGLSFEDKIGSLQSVDSEIRLLSGIFKESVRRNSGMNTRERSQSVYRSAFSTSLRFNLNYLISEFSESVFHAFEMEPKLVNTHRIVILSGQLFQEIIEGIYNQKNLYLQESINTSKFFLEMTKCMYKLGLFTPTPISKMENIRTKGKKKQSGEESVDNSIPLVFISQETIGMIMDIIEIKMTRNFEFKKNMLDSLRYILKERRMESLVKWPDFLTRLRSVCSEETDGAYKYNEASWKVLYHIIKYHSGMISYLINAEIFQHFVELLSTKTLIITANCLNYLSKLFQMVEIEEFKLSTNQKKRSSRFYEKNPIKSFKKDVKTILDFCMKKKVFIRLHVIFKSIEKSQGIAYVKLSKLYQTILFGPSCANHLKEIKKKKAYIDVLEKMTEYSENRIKESQTKTKGKKKKKELIIF